MQAQERRFREQAERQHADMQAQERPNRGSRATVPRASGKATGRHESHASMPCESFFVWPGRTTYNNFSDGYSYFFAL